MIRYSTAVTISATPALSSPPRRVVPSVTINSCPIKSFRNENFSTSVTMPLLSSMSPPSYTNALAFISAPLTAGDVIVGVGDISINNVNVYTQCLRNYPPDTELTISVMRYSAGEYKEISLNIVTGEHEN